MYAEFVLVGHGQTQYDQDVISIRQKDSNLNWFEVENHQEYRSNIQKNEKYLNGQLLPNARSSNDSLKYQLKNKGIQVVVVAPSVPALQTCLDLFGEQEGIEIYVEPLLQQRINSTGSIPGDLEDILSKFRTQPYTNKLEDKNWYMEYGRQTDFTEGNHQDKVLSHIRQNGEFEKVDWFLQRNLRLRKALFEYHQKTKKRVCLIAHPQVLETLTATSWFEDGKLVNAVHVNFGQTKRQYVWIEGVEAEAEEKQIPICGGLG